MTRALRLVGVAAALAAPALLSAQSASADKPVSFGVSGGLSMPMGDLGNDANSGYTVAGHVFFKPATINAVRFRGDVAYDKWAVKESGGDANLRSLSFVANALYDFPSQSNIRPYLIGGLGLYNSKAMINLGQVTGSTNGTTDLGLQVGGGLTFKLSGFDTFAEAKFVNVFSSGSSTTWIPITVGVRF
jgi:opacity protein-like surface antigen